MAYRQIAWCYSLGQALRQQDALAGLDTFIDPDEIAFIQQNNNRPYAMLMLHMQDLKNMLLQNSLNPYQQVQLSATIARLCDSMGKCERINSTVFPVTYRLFVHFFIYLFLIILSLGLVETIGIFEIPVLIVIASTFFLVEKTATHMQDPFRNRPTDTAMTAIARNIEISIKQILQDENVPQPLKPEKFYLM
jgi:ion channel-forming bestrophin family protein